MGTYRIIVIGVCNGSSSGVEGIHRIIVDCNVVDDGGGGGHGRRWKGDRENSLRIGMIMIARGRRVDEMQSAAVTSKTGFCKGNSKGSVLGGWSVYLGEPWIF